MVLLPVSGACMCPYEHADAFVFLPPVHFPVAAGGSDESSDERRDNAREATNAPKGPGSAYNPKGGGQRKTLRGAGQHP